MAEDCKILPATYIFTNSKDGKTNGNIITLLNIHEPLTRHIEQVYITQCYPGLIKGPHMHEGNKFDRFYCIGGTAVVVCRNEDTGVITEFILRAFDNQILLIPPRNSHAITPLGPIKETTVLSMPTEGYDKNVPYNQVETTYEGYNWDKWR